MNIDKLTAKTNDSITWQKEKNFCLRKLFSVLSYDSVDGSII